MSLPPPGPEPLPPQVPPSAPAPAAMPRLPARPAWLWVLLMAVVLALLIALALTYLRQLAQRDGERLTASLAQVIAEQATRTLQTVDLRLQMAASQLAALEAGGQATGEDVRQVLAEQARDMPFVRALWVLDRDGRRLWDSRNAAIGESFADRAYYLAVRERPDRGFYAGPLIKSRITGQWTMAVSRPLPAPPGQAPGFSGVIAASIEPAYFEQLWRDVNLGSHAAVTLFRRDGQVMMRSPTQQELLGQYVPHLSLFTEHLPNSPQGVFTTLGRLDGIPRVAAYHVLEAYPELLVQVGLDRADLLAPWTRLAWLSGLVWLLVTASALAVTGLLAREQRRLRASGLQLAALAASRQQLVEQVQSLNAGLERTVQERTAELARQELLFRTLAESVPEPFWTVDNRGGATFLSRAWYDLVGGEPAQWLGYGWREAMHPDDLARLERQWVRDAKAAREHTGRRRLRARDGSWHTMAFKAIPVRDPDGQVRFWVGIDVDITTILANEEALRLVNEQLHAFSYTVSHDLQAPLQRIRSFADVLGAELGPQASPRALHFLDRIRGNAQDMARLVTDLLALAQVAQLDIVSTRVSITELAVQALQRLQAEHPHRAVRWSVAPGLSARGDVRLMRSVIDNLLDNAWKFTARTADATIEVGGPPESGNFHVRDNGAGFDMAHAGQMFGTFRRLHREDEFPGTGVGLATVARAIQRMGGRIQAEGSPGQGATFHCVLPPPDGGEPPSLRTSSGFGAL